MTIHKPFNIIVKSHLKNGTLSINTPEEFNRLKDELDIVSLNNVNSGDLMKLFIINEQDELVTMEELLIANQDMETEEIEAINKLKVGDFICLGMCDIVQRLL